MSIAVLEGPLTSYDLVGLVRWPHGSTGLLNPLPLGLLLEAKNVGIDFLQSGTEKRGRSRQIHPKSNSDASDLTYRKAHLRRRVILGPIRPGEVGVCVHSYPCILFGRSDHFGDGGSVSAPGRNEMGNGPGEGFWRG